MFESSIKRGKMNNLPLNLQNAKYHKTNIISILFLVKFGVFVFWWWKLTFLYWTHVL